MRKSLTLFVFYLKKKNKEKCIEEKQEVFNMKNLPNINIFLLILRIIYFQEVDSYILKMKKLIGKKKH